jgi:hypothetical protein
MECIVWPPTLLAAIPVGAIATTFFLFLPKDDIRCFIIKLLPTYKCFYLLRLHLETVFVFVKDSYLNKKAPW